MRKEFLLLFGLFGGAAVLAQDRMFIHQSDHITLGAQISVTDSLYFSSDGSSVYFSISGNSLQYAVSTAFRLAITPIPFT